MNQTTDTAKRPARPPVAENQDTFTLTKEERLELENLELKGRLLQLQMETIAADRQCWGAAVGQRCGIEITTYEINVDTGVCTKIGGRAPTPGAAGS